MKFTSEIELNLPVDRVIELFDNPDNMYKWQPELTSFEHISGESGQPGAKSKLTYNMGKRTVEMIETVLVRNLPDEFSGTYETKGVYNHISNQFVHISENKSKWISHNEFQFSGFMAVMAFLMKGSFKKQTMKFMKQFKAFAEGEAA